MNFKPYIIISGGIFAVCAAVDMYWFFNQEIAPGFLIEINVIAVILCLVLVTVQAVPQKNKK